MSSCPRWGNCSRTATASAEPCKTHRFPSLPPSPGSLCLCLPSVGSLHVSLCFLLFWLTPLPSAFACPLLAPCMVPFASAFFASPPCPLPLLNLSWLLACFPLLPPFLAQPPLLPLCACFPSLGLLWLTVCLLPLLALCWLTACSPSLSAVLACQVPIASACPLLAHCIPFPFPFDSSNALPTACPWFAPLLPTVYSCLADCLLFACFCLLSAWLDCFCLSGGCALCLHLLALCPIICLPLSVQWVCMTSAYIRLTFGHPLQMCVDEDVDPNGPCQQYTEANDVLRDLKSNLREDKQLLMQVLASVWRKVMLQPLPFSTHVMLLVLLCVRLTP